MARIKSDASDLRRGGNVGTAVTTSFECRAVDTVMNNSFLSRVRNLSLSLKKNASCYDELKSMARVEIVKDCGTLHSFEVMCEALVSLFHFGLLYSKEMPRNNDIEDLFKHFTDKWFLGYERLNQLACDVDDKYKISSFGSIILLYLINNCDHHQVEAFEVVLRWKSPQLQSPLWLTELLSCRENEFQNYNYILYKSLINYYDIEVKIQCGALVALCEFIDGCYSYKLGNYEKSINDLRKIDEENCGSYLIGWKHTLTGLNMECLCKPNSALMEYKNSIISSNNHYAVFYASRVIKQIWNPDLHLESLNFVRKVDGKTGSVDSSMQKTIISILLPEADGVPLKFSWLLAAALLSYEKWDEACEELGNLLQLWEGYGVEDCRSRPVHKILTPRNDIPKLPPKTFASLCHRASLMMQKKYEHVITEAFEGSPDASIFNKIDEVGSDKKIECLSYLISCISIAEALLHQRDSDSSLEQCGRSLTLSEKLVSSSPRWLNIIYLTKTYLYKILALINSSPQTSRGNFSHFTRLHQQFLQLFKDTDAVNTGTEEDFTESSFFEITVLYLKKRLAELGVQVSN